LVAKLKPNRTAPPRPDAVHRQHTPASAWGSARAIHTFRCAGDLGPKSRRRTRGTNRPATPRPGVPRSDRARQPPAHQQRPCPADRARSAGGTNWRPGSPPRPPSEPSGGRTASPVGEGLGVRAGTLVAKLKPNRTAPPRPDAVHRQHTPRHRAVRPAHSTHVPTAETLGRSLEGDTVDETS